MSGKEKMMILCESNKLLVILHTYYNCDKSFGALFGKKHNFRLQNFQI